MRLSTRQHGIFDYGFGAALIAMPWALGFASGGAAMLAPILAGVALIINALLTQFELGVIRRIQVPLHLWIDGILGILLALSPWLASFDQTVWVPHVVAGLLSAAVAFLSETIPGYDRRGVSTGAAK
jgi:hypothetical protein